MEYRKHHGEYHMIRLYAQYADKPNAVAWYNILPTVSNSLQTAYNAITASWDIDNNVQEQLDVIGRIVVMDNPWSFVSNDETYRALIKSKIAKNNSDATISGIIESMSYIIDDNTIIVGDYEDMSFDVAFIEPITLDQIDLLNNFDLVPKPQGVRFRGYAVLPTVLLYGDVEAVYGEPTAQYGFYFGGT